MLIDLTPADRKAIISDLKFAERDSLNSVYGSANRASDDEVEKEYREIDRIKKFYGKLIAKIESPRKRRKSPAKGV